MCNKYLFPKHKTLAQINLLKNCFYMISDEIIKNKDEKECPNWYKNSFFGVIFIPQKYSRN